MIEVVESCLSSLGDQYQYCKMYRPIILWYLLNGLFIPDQLELLCISTECCVA